MQKIFIFKSYLILPSSQKYFKHLLKAYIITEEQLGQN